jgi:magnesium chelatase family protein
MKIYSLTDQNFELVAFEVEVNLLRGLPQISLMGQASSLIKESVPKIQSAIKSQGFKLPRAQRILIDLKPQILKKNNLGIELAIACAILLETGQIELFGDENKPWLIVGHLSLKGEVRAIERALEDFTDLNLYNIIVPKGTRLRADHFEIEKLTDLHAPEFVRPKMRALEKVIPRSLPSQKFSKSAARLLEILACGEHSCLIAGPVGSGKSTLASIVPKLLQDPVEKDIAEIRKVQNFFKHGSKLRPEVIAHHSISPIAFLGGGAKLYPGEVTRAHKGTLIMDEFLQFHQEIQAALREPLENGRLVIARNGNFSEFPAEFLLIATTNLCPCGEFSRNTLKSCRCTRLKLKNYLGRISGPCIDRFQILSFSSDWENQRKEISLDQIFSRVQVGNEFRKIHRQQPHSNSKMSDEEMNLESAQNLITHFFKIEFLSERRRIALLKVARTIADLEQSEKIQMDHLNEAFDLSISPLTWVEEAQKAQAWL